MNKITTREEVEELPQGDSMYIEMIVQIYGRRCSSPLEADGWTIFLKKFMKELNRETSCVTNRHCESEQIMIELNHSNHLCKV